MTRFAEDLEVGERHTLGSYSITRSDIIAFASEWDPQTFHISSDPAVVTQFGDVIASGVQTLAIFQRLSVLSEEAEWAVIAGAGLREVRFVSPVYPDTTLSASSRIVSVALERARNRGMVTKHGVMFDGERQVLDLKADAYVRMRSARQ